VRLAATNTSNVITYPVVVEVENPDQSLLPGMTANAEIEISLKQNVLSVANAALRFRPADESNGAGAPGAPGRNPAAGAGRGGAGAFDNFSKIAAGLKLDASQQAAFDEALQGMRDRMRAAAQNGAGAGAAPGGQNGGRAAAGGGDRSARFAERIKKGFEGFRASLKPEQQAQWDAALAAMAAGKRAPVYHLVDGKPEAVVLRIGASDGTRTEILGGELKEGDEVIVGSARPGAEK
jgi:HlyD family secretion protein